jgi:hypothetical protein
MHCCTATSAKPCCKHMLQMETADTRDTIWKRLHAFESHVLGPLVPCSATSSWGALVGGAIPNRRADSDRRTRLEGWIFESALLRRDMNRLANGTLDSEVDARRAMERIVCGCRHGRASRRSAAWICKHAHVTTNMHFLSICSCCLLTAGAL